MEHTREKQTLPPGLDLRPHALNVLNVETSSSRFSVCISLHPIDQKKKKNQHQQPQSVQSRPCQSVQYSLTVQHMPYSTPLFISFTHYTKLLRISTLPLTNKVSRHFVCCFTSSPLPRYHSYNSLFCANNHSTLHTLNDVIRSARKPFPLLFSPSIPSRPVFGLEMPHRPLAILSLPRSHNGFMKGPVFSELLHRTNWSAVSFSYSSSSSTKIRNPQ